MTDAEIIAAMERECFSGCWEPDAVREQLLHDSTVYVLSENGYALGTVCADEAELYRIGVLPQRRRNGAGAALLADFEGACRQRGAEKIFLEVRSQNASAISLYEKSGFEKIAVRKNYYPDDDAVIYRKEPLCALAYVVAGENDLELLTKTRLTVLRAANKLPEDHPLPEVEKNTLDYYRRALSDGSHYAVLVFDGERFVGAGGVTFYGVMPTCCVPDGRKAYIMNMYTDPLYRRRGIAMKTLGMLVCEAKRCGIKHIGLEATDMGRPLYERFGFVSAGAEMTLPL